MCNGRADPTLTKKFMFDNLNNSDWQNFTYSALILVVLVSSLLSRREVSFAKTMKYIAIWAGIALVAVIGYSYRFEFSDLKERVIMALNPTAVRVNKEGQMVINLADDGHFYVDVKINGEPVRFMIDTGASDIVLNVNEAKKVGIDVNRLVFNKRYETANGEAYGASVFLDELEIGGVKFNRLRASVNSANMGISLLGMSFLRQFHKYEFYQDKLVLTL